MAQVWKAWDPELERFVALKIIREGTEQEQKRFVVEARAAGSLNHPNIAGVHDFGDDEGFSYIAFDYIDGATSWDEEPTLKRAIEIVRDSARGVQHAHEKGIIHRDIKPANIMVGKNGQTYVTDFGLARRISSREQLTISGASIGTPSYMSPEQAEGHSHTVDGTTDVYSLGATLYALLTRKAPFDGDSAFMVMLQVIRNDPTPPSDICPEIDQDLETIILKCLEKLPKNRYHTAGDLADELTRYLNQEPIQAIPTSSTKKFARKVVRKKEILTISLFLFLFLSSLGYIAWQNIQKEEVPVLVPEGPTSEETKEFRTRLQDIDNRIEKLRFSFYIENVNLSGQLEELKNTLEDLEAYLEKAPPTLTPQGWKSVGVGWYVYGDRTRAETRLLQAEKTLENDPELRLHLGRIYLDRSRSLFLEEGATPADDKAKSPSIWIAKAQFYFQPAEETAEEPPPGIDQDLIRLYLALTEGEKDLVLEEAKKGWEKNSEELGSEEYLVLLGMAATPDVAIADYTKAIRRRPHYALGYFLRGWTYHILGNPEKALEDLNAAIKINPNLALAYNERAAIKVLRGDFVDALNDYNRTIELSPTFANACNNRGVFYYGQGDMKNALRDFTQVIKLEPTFALPYNNRGAVYRNLGQDEPAMADFNRCIQLDPEYPSGYFNRGNIYLDRKEYEEAIRDYTQGLEISPYNPPFLYNRAVAQWERKEYEAALEDLNRALNLDPYKTHAALLRGQVHEQLQMWNEAIQDYQQATSIKPNAAEAHFRLGILLSRAGQHKNAREELTRCIKINPEFEKVWFNRGVVNAILGNLEEAMNDYDEEIRLQPNYAQTWYSRGNLRRKVRDFDGALKDYSQAIELKPKFPEAISNRADIHMMMGKVTEAIRDYKKALSIAPPDWAYREKVEATVRRLQRQ